MEQSSIEHTASAIQSNRVTTCPGMSWKITLFLECPGMQKWPGISWETTKQVQIMISGSDNPAQ